MKTKLIIFLITIISLATSSVVFASITNGTIDTTYHYAWGENVGFVDFKNITISDTALSGSAYGENIGWIDLSTVTNTNEGVLSGYAWGENVGFVDFSKATIGTDGVFAGGAYSENTGWITFGTGDNKVLTDWRPASVRPRTSGGSSIRPPVISPVITAPIPTTTPLTTISSITKTLKLNMKGNEIKILQTYLNNNGYVIATSGFGSPGQETNFFGPLTKKAIIKFQIANKLKPDGIVGPLTLNKLKLLIN